MQQAPDGQITLEENDTLFIYKTGGFTGGGYGDPVFVRLETIPDLFITVRDLVQKLSASGTTAFKPDSKTSNEYFVVKAGPPGAVVRDLKLVFDGATKGSYTEIRDLHANIQGCFPNPRDLRPQFR